MMGSDLTKRNEFTTASCPLYLSSEYLSDASDPIWLAQQSVFGGQESAMSISALEFWYLCENLFKSSQNGFWLRPEGRHDRFRWPLLFVQGALEGVEARANPLKL